jgi:hypothetical protein
VLKLHAAFAVKVIASDDRGPTPISPATYCPQVSESPFLPQVAVTLPMFFYPEMAPSKIQIMQIFCKPCLISDKDGFGESIRALEGILQIPFYSLYAFSRTEETCAMFLLRDQSLAVSCAS